MRIYFNSTKFVEVVMPLHLGIGMYDYHQAAASHTSSTHGHLPLDFSEGTAPVQKYRIFVVPPL